MVDSKSDSGITGVEQYGTGEGSLAGRTGDCGRDVRNAISRDGNAESVMNRSAGESEGKSATDRHRELGAVGGLGMGSRVSPSENVTVSVTENWAADGQGWFLQSLQWISLFSMQILSQ